jgi:hypothetical protein
MRLRGVAPQRTSWANICCLVRPGAACGVAHHHHKSRQPSEASGNHIRARYVGSKTRGRLSGDRRA